MNTTKANTPPKIPENSKYMCLGEFKEELELHCPSCSFNDFDNDCELCNGNVEYTQKITISWSNCKDIFQKMSIEAEKEGIVKVMKREGI